MKKKLIILSGAGVSAESGVQTFRDSDGLWEGFNVNDVATPEGFEKNPALVLDFYNQRRRQLKSVLPNIAHEIIASLENHFDVQIITQNVDNLHEKAGSSNVLHLHGELLKIRSTKNKNFIKHWDDDLVLGDLDPDGHQLRPHIVWFGEDVPALEQAVNMVQNADFLIVIGTSLQVYPAAGLMHFAPSYCSVFYIDPKPAHIFDKPENLKIIEQIASKGMKTVEKLLLKLK